jgi:hypothetical protein
MNPDGPTEFRAASPAGKWGLTSTYQSEPIEIFASAEIAAAYNTGWPDEFVIHSDFLGQVVLLSPDRFWSNTHFDGADEDVYPIGGTSETHVPRLGQFLEGYHVTDVSMLVTYLRDPASPAVDGATIRLRFYGEPVPEPQTWLLGSYAVLFHLRTRRWADNSGAR